MHARPYTHSSLPETAELDRESLELSDLIFSNYTVILQFHNRLIDGLCDTKNAIVDWS
jgi:propanediol dehydratase large subunit